MVPISQGFKASRLFLLGSFLIVLSEASKALDFPGAVSCLDDGLKLRKPKGLRLASWKTLHAVDSAGIPVTGCSDLVDGKTANIPANCITYEMGMRLVHITFDGLDSSIYRAVCNDLQADEAESGTVVNCTQDSMAIKFPRKLPAFDDEVVVPRPQIWNIQINNRGVYQPVTMNQARAMGYIMTTDADFMMIQTAFTAVGVEEYTLENQKLYVGAVRLTSPSGMPRIVVDIPMICTKGPHICNETHISIYIPSFGGDLQGISIKGVTIPLNNVAFPQRNGLVLHIDGKYLKGTMTNAYLPPLILVFKVNDITVPMLLSPSCVPGNPQRTHCSPTGFMNFEILDTHTNPKLNLSTVIFGDGTCPPVYYTNKLVYNVSLLSCGTRTRIVNGGLIYENEVRALRKEFGHGTISRDSELRITVQCYFSDSHYSPLNLTVVTVPPPVSSKSEGPLSLKLDLFLDDSYRSAYTDSQYPVMKTLREPIFLEVRILNRDDPNIELVLDDCWATMSRDPTALPQWNIVVDGCQEARDDHVTIFHPVGLDVPYPNHHKRFEVKTFAFMSGGEASTNLVYIHCSAIICNKMTPDFPLCTRTCLASRRRRDLGNMHVHKGSLVSLPGPVLIMETEAAVQTQGQTSVLKDVTIGLLPALALIAVTVSGVSLVSVFKARNVAK